MIIHICLCLSWIFLFLFIFHYKGLSERDSMTHAYNKDWFMGKKNSKLVRMMRATHKKNGRSFGFFIIDLDDFKYVNDTYGHFYGDKIITETVTALYNVLKGRDTLARIGGDEFAIIIPGLQNAAQIKQIAMDLERTIDNNTFRSASVGGALYTNNSLIEVKTLMERTDRKMYDSKRVKKSKRC